MQPLASTQTAVDALLSRVGRHVLLATPLAIGKPNVLLNALYQRAKADPSVTLAIHTALTLARPRGRSDLERRFLGPMVQRVFGDYPDLDYELDRLAGKLPSNVQVIEFYFPAGKQLGSQAAQRDHVSSNYTHVARDLVGRGVNLLAQQVCAGVVAGRPKLSLSSNPDLTLDLLAALRGQRAAGRDVAAVAQLNEQLPFMHGDAVVEPDVFDYVIDEPAGHYKPFGPPKLSVSDADHLIGLYASALVKDGGELQVGIGSLGDAIVYSLIMRHERNDAYLGVLAKLGIRERAGEVIGRLGDTGRFEQGLFAATEMLVDGFMHLIEAGIVKRKVYDDVALSRLRNEGRIGDDVTPDLLDLLRGRKAIHSVLTEEDLRYLQYFGVLRESLRWEDGQVVSEDGRRCAPDLASAEARALLGAHLGDKLARGAIVHAGFFLGPTAFYDWLRGLPDERRKLIDMRSVTRINQLYGHEELDKLHRRDARFVNTTMFVTLLGAAASDALEDGRVVSGVGGQYNFVAMAHELPGGRSVLQLRSTRSEHGTLRSNLVWSYGHVTIPRHLRDIVITEYGVADLRGRTDEECVMQMLQVADSRFQPELLAQAKRAGKLRQSYELPERHRSNLPESYGKPLAELKEQGFFPAFPFGTDLTSEEQRLGKALRRLAAAIATKKGMARALMQAATAGGPGDDVQPLLQRMELHAPKNARERLYARLLSAALRG